MIKGLGEPSMLMSVGLNASRAWLILMPYSRSGADRIEAQGAVSAHHSSLPFSRCKLKSIPVQGLDYLHTVQGVVTWCVPQTRLVSCAKNGLWLLWRVFREFWQWGALLRHQCHRTIHRIVQAADDFKKCCAALQCDAA